MTEKEIDKILASALEDAVYQEFLETTESSDERTAPSSKYRRRKQLMLRNPWGYEQKCEHTVPKKTLRMVASIVLVFALGFGMVMASPTTRASVFKYFVVQQEKYVSFQFRDGNGKTPEVKAGDWKLTKIPRGYTETVYQEDELVKRCAFTHESKPKIEFSAKSLSATFSINIGAEHSTLRITTINQQKAYRFESESEHYGNMLIWFDEDESYVFQLFGKVPMNTLLSMAKSLTKKS